ncbi:MAG: DNA repair protein RadA, partial [Nitrospirae bacterium]
MVTRPKTTFRCQQCGYQFPRLLGRCPECKSWNSMQEERTPEVGKGRPRAVGGPSGPLPLAEIESGLEARLLTHVGEFDRILGGGVVRGSVVLIGGDPGIGKTTLLLQILPRLAQPPERVLYVSGEESPRQIKMRCERLGIGSEALLIYPETNLEEILKTTQTVAPAALVVDSIQTTFTSLLTSAPGSISQVQEVAAQLMFYAKRSGTPVFLIGHVTKDGAIAGPRTLEHIVDTVL